MVIYYGHGHNKLYKYDKTETKKNDSDNNTISPEDSGRKIARILSKSLKWKMFRFICIYVCNLYTLTHLSIGIYIYVCECLYTLINHNKFLISLSL